MHYQRRMWMMQYAMRVAHIHDQNQQLAITQTYAFKYSNLKIMNNINTITHLYMNALSRKQQRHEQQRRMSELRLVNTVKGIVKGKCQKSSAQQLLKSQGGTNGSVHSRSFLQPPPHLLWKCVIQIRHEGKGQYYRVLNLVKLGG